MDRCAARDHDIDGVQHQAGEYLLEAGEFTRAIARLNRCLELADISGDRWYENSARLMRAYCAAKIGDFDLAARDADGLESDGGLGWLAADPVVCKRSVLEMINGTQEPK
jgi:tetratricopeptide (TPR) repeat protein